MSSLASVVSTRARETQDRRGCGSHPHTHGGHDYLPAGVFLKVLVPGALSLFLPGELGFLFGAGAKPL